MGDAKMPLRGLCSNCGDSTQVPTYLPTGLAPCVVLVPGTRPKALPCPALPHLAQLGRGAMKHPLPEPCYGSSICVLALVGKHAAAAAYMAIAIGPALPIGL